MICIKFHERNKSLKTYIGIQKTEKRRFLPSHWLYRCAGGRQPRVPGRVLLDPGRRDVTDSNVWRLHKSVFASGAHKSRLQRHARQQSRSEEVRWRRNLRLRLRYDDAQGLLGLMSHYVGFTPPWSVSKCGFRASEAWRSLRLDGIGRCDHSYHAFAVGSAI